MPIQVAEAAPDLSRSHFRQTIRWSPRAMPSAGRSSRGPRAWTKSARTRRSWRAQAAPRQKSCLTSIGSQENGGAWLQHSAAEPGPHRRGPGRALSCNGRGRPGPHNRSPRQRGPRRGGPAPVRAASEPGSPSPPRHLRRIGPPSRAATPGTPLPASCHAAQGV